MNVLVKRIANLVVFITVAIFNYLSNSLPFNGITQPEMSERYFTFVTPAGYAFTIWAVIYSLLLAFMIYQLVPKSFDNEIINHDIGFWWIVNGLLNCVWLVTWHYQLLQLWLSFFVMLCIFASLLVINYNIFTQNRKSKKDGFNSDFSGLWQYLGLEMVWSIYLAWIVIAMIANLFAAATNVTDPVYIPWAIVALAGAVVVEGGFAVVTRDPMFPAVGAWALGAIANNEKIPSDQVKLTATIGWILLTAEAVTLLAYNLYQRLMADRKSSYREV